MVGLTEFGGTLFTLKYDNHQITFEPSPLLNQPIHPEFLLSDLQLIYWPSNKIQEKLPSGTTLVQNESPVLHRFLIVNNEKIINFEYDKPQIITRKKNMDFSNIWYQQVSFTHLKYHYALIIETLEMNML